MDSNINRKVHLCTEQPNLGVIFCVGKTEEEYENGLLLSVVNIQIKKWLMGLKPEDLDCITIAYKPLWTIGTGKVATNYCEVAHGGPLKIIVCIGLMLLKKRFGHGI